MLPDRPPQVTFTCDVPSSTCGFQFWIGKVESFYCGLSNCTSSLQIGYDSNSTEYTCQDMQCACIPGKMLCGEDGSVGALLLGSNETGEKLTRANRHLRLSHRGDQGTDEVQHSFGGGQQV